MQTEGRGSASPQSTGEAIWERIAAGRSAALLGMRSPSPPAGRPLTALRIDCGGRGGALALARDLLAGVGELLGESPRRWLPRELRADPGLRQRLLDEAPERVWGSALLRALQDLGRRSGGRAALIFEGIDEARPAVAHLVAELLRRSSPLHVPLLLTCAAPEPQSPAALELLALLSEREGADAILRVVEPTPVEEPTATEEPGADDLVPDELMRVLRALAIASPDAELDALAALLDLAPLRVLEQLQAARDMGIEVIDRGDGRFSMAPDLADALRSDLLPSLERAYHRELASWHAPREASPGPTQAAEWGRQPEPMRRPLETTGAEPASKPEPTKPSATRTIPIRWGDEAAGTHAEAAGDLELAASRYLRALEEAARLGLHIEAVELGERALEALDQQPENVARRRLRMEVLAALGAAHWRGAGTSPKLTLERARQYVEACRELVDPDDWELTARLDGLLAQVLYDVGSREALEEALAAVTRASRTWHGAGEPLRAARLLNDEAAIWVRLGDPVRAHHLLERSREVFGKLAPESEEARLEAAETEHLLARLVLHVAPRPGREEEAFEVSMAHAKVAEETYEELSRERELARVRETLGRLAQLRGDERAAGTYLRAAAEAQRDDPIGLARTAAALAELRAARGEATAALELLSDSIQLNLDSRSPLGLAYNRQTLDTMAARLERDADTPLVALRRQLDEAERALGSSESATFDQSPSPLSQAPSREAERDDGR